MFLAENGVEAKMFDSSLNITTVPQFILHLFNIMISETCRAVVR